MKAHTSLPMLELTLLVAKHSSGPCQRAAQLLSGWTMVLFRVVTRAGGSM